MEPMAKVAYDAYRQRLARDAADGGLPEWEDLEPVEREAWDAAAQAVGSHYE